MTALYHAATNPITGWRSCSQLSSTSALRMKVAWSSNGSVLVNKNNLSSAKRATRVIIPRDDLMLPPFKILCIPFLCGEFVLNRNHWRFHVPCVAGASVRCAFRGRPWRLKRASRGPNFGFWPSAGSWLFVLAWFGGPNTPEVQQMLWARNYIMRINATTCTLWNTNMNTEHGQWYFILVALFCLLILDVYFVDGNYKLYIINSKAVQMLRYSRHQGLQKTLLRWFRCFRYLYVFRGVPVIPSQLNGGHVSDMSCRLSLMLGLVHFFKRSVPIHINIHARTHTRTRHTHDIPIYQVQPLHFERPIAINAIWLAISLFCGKMLSRSKIPTHFFPPPRHERKGMTETLFFDS